VKRLGLDALREDTKTIKDIAFKPSGATDVSEPKYGKEDEKNEEHSGGNTWAGGVSYPSLIMNGGFDCSVIADGW
jgi:von Willebrand factor A domain-containing protein 8